MEYFGLAYAPQSKDNQMGKTFPPYVHYRLTKFC